MECNGLPVFRWLACVLKKHFWRKALHCHNGRNLAVKSSSSCSEWQKPEQNFEPVKLALCFSFSSACESKEIATLFDKSCSSPEDIFEYDGIAAGAVLPSLVRNSQCGEDVKLVCEVL